MSDSKETLSDINRLFPNFNAFIKVVLKKERLSEEAELNRARYEAIIKAMEEGHLPPRPVSLIGDDDSGYHSTKPKGALVPDQIPTVCQTGFLLKRDDKFRWHRYWCRLDGKDMKFFVFNDSHEDTLVKSVPLATVTTSFSSPQTAVESDKENCFVLTGTADAGEESGSGTSEEIVLAAYSDVDYQQWCSAFSILSGTRDSMRISSGSLLDSSHWAPLPPSHDTASTSSSNFSSNRESVISTTSSLPYTLRLPSHESPPRGRSPLEQGAVVGDTSTLSAKQMQPLPSPPPEDGGQEDDDTASVCTIYENIDNLVLQFDSTMQATVQAMGQFGQQLGNSKKQKKKDRSLLRQASFFKGGKGSKSRLSAKQKSELERGETFSGHLHKRSSTGSWKKKWCVLKGAVLSYSKNMDDAEGREYVILDAQIEKITDPKKSFAFTIQLRGVPEALCFGTEDESVMNEWITKLETASISKRDFSWDMWKDQDSDEQPSHYHSQTSLDSEGTLESHYNVPRAILPPTQGSAAPSAAQPIPAVDAVNNGIYSVPSSLPALDLTTFSVNGKSFSLSGDPYAQYDVPRPVSIMPHEEAIYDYPENVVDMEIYDYPPDALSLLPPPPDQCLLLPESSRNSVVTLSSNFTMSGRSSLAMPEDWMMNLPPPPPVSLSSSRPSIAISTTSSDEFFQSARNSVASIEGLQDQSRSRNSSSFNRSSMGELMEEQVAAILPSETATEPSQSQLEFGVCAVRGWLYKKERFTWTKMDCLIRNSFLECHKPNSSQGPSLKLFLPRSIVAPDREVRRQWAIKVKHPRRDGVLQFAAENEEDYKRWMKAFSSAAAIEVQSVNTMDEIRITDLEMQSRWTTLERNTPTLQPPETTEPKRKNSDELPPMMSTGRRNTYSAGDEYMSDTLKRRRKFSWIKTLSRKRGLHHNATSESQLASDKQHMNGGGTLTKQQSGEGWAQQVPAVVVSPEDRARLITTDDGVEQFQGYLHVQRKGADNMWVRYWCILEDLIISCYISRSDLSLTLSIQLKGSRVADAANECKRQLSFKIWHLESGQCLFFAADDSIEYTSWFKEITKGAEYVVPLDAGISNSPLAAPFYHYTKDTTSDSSPSQRSSRSSIASLPELDLDTAPVSNSGGVVVYKGNLKKLTQSKWKDRYCHIRDATLQVFATPTEKTLLTTVPLPGARVELVSVPNEDVHQFTFRVCPTSGKTHMFCAVSEQEMYMWATTLQDVSHQSSDANDPMGKPKKKVVSLRNIEKLYTPIPAGQLLNPVHAGYAEVLALGSWERYWCVVHSGALYLYQTHESPATSLTIVLKGYHISVGGPRGCKKPCVIAMQQSGLHTTFMSVLDQNEMNMWFNALERGTRMESTLRHFSKPALPPTENTVSGRDVRVEVTPAPGSSSGTKTKKTREQSVDKKEEVSGTLPQHVIRRYEKKIRKTHRVANMTEQNLKRQQASLAHFKKELSQTTGKLKELADKGDEHAIKRLKSVRVKLQQIEKILPYIGKYIMVNRQAEIQTVAILKESCTVDIQRLKRGNSPGPSHPTAEQETSKSSYIPLETHAEEVESTSPAEPNPPPIEVMASSETLVEQVKEPEVAVAQSVVPQLQTPQLQTPQLQTAQPQIAQPQTESALCAEPTEPAPPPPQSSPELDEQPQLSSPQTCDLPYANLASVQAEVHMIHKQEEEEKETKREASGPSSATTSRESPYATLASVRPANPAKAIVGSEDEVQYAEIVKVMSPTLVSPPSAPRSPYAELDFTRMQAQEQPESLKNQQQHRLTPTSPRSRLNYVEVSFNSSKSKSTISDETDSKDVDTTLIAGSERGTTENSAMDKTLTPSDQTPTVTHSSPATKSRAAALQDAIRLFEPTHSSTPVKSASAAKTGPPPVKKKPKQNSSSSSSNRSSLHQESTPSPSHTPATATTAATDAADSNGKKDTGHDLLEDSPPLVSGSSETQSEATGTTMSVLERIKVLQQKSS